MLSNEFLTELHNLSRAEKLRVMQLLVGELAKEEGLLTDRSVYEVWSPYAASAAADTLLKLLEEDTQSSDS